MARFVRSAVLSTLLVATAARAEDQCRVLELSYTPAALATLIKTPPQVVAWLETPSGQFIATVYITAQTGTYGLGNRPGAVYINSGPMWPYGRRTSVFPVWAHRHNYSFREVVFQDTKDEHLSHSAGQSSQEKHYCQPLRTDDTDWQLADAGTCASPSYTDKGRFSTAASLYPPRADLARDAQRDASDVDAFGTANPFDAISQATPVLDQQATATWTIPPNVPAGDYVLWVEVSREFDHNATYSIAARPAPTLDGGFDEWGAPYRGQPSVVYKVPFTLGATTTTAMTASYAGYGDPDGEDGDLRPPDMTITTTVRGSGAQRLELVNGYRVHLSARAEPDFAPPAAPGDLAIAGVTSHSAVVEMRAPGDDELTGRARRYEVRLAVGHQEITEQTFGSLMLVESGLTPEDPGTMQSFEIPNLLFETDYTLAARAVDDCMKEGPISIVKFKTGERAQGEVDACFVATAAYGSVMAADVDMLRRFRDTVLRSSVLGELAIEAYYTFGPAVSGVVGESDVLRATVRAILEPIVSLVRGAKLLRL